MAVRLRGRGKGENETQTREGEGKGEKGTKMMERMRRCRSRRMNGVKECMHERWHHHSFTSSVCVRIHSDDDGRSVWVSSLSPFLCVRLCMCVRMWMLERWLRFTLLSLDCTLLRRPSLLLLLLCSMEPWLLSCVSLLQRRRREKGISIIFFRN